MRWFKFHGLHLLILNFQALGYLEGLSYIWYTLIGYFMQRNGSKLFAVGTTSSLVRCYLIICLILTFRTYLKWIVSTWFCLITDIYASMAQLELYFVSFWL